MATAVQLASSLEDGSARQAILMSFLASIVHIPELCIHLILSSAAFQTWENELYLWVGRLTPETVPRSVSLQMLLSNRSLSRLLAIPPLLQAESL